MQDIQSFLLNKYAFFLENYLWKIAESASIMIAWVIFAFLLYRFIIYIFVRFNLLDLINKLEEKMWASVNDKKTSKTKALEKTETLTNKFQIDEIVAKSVAYYVFLLFLRFAIAAYGIQDIEEFMDELLRYLPKLFTWVAIWYFGFRFSKFVYDIVYFAFWVKAKDTAKIVAAWARGIIIFFVVMAVLDQVGIATEVTTTLLNGFIAMLAIAWGLAFWLGGKDVAKEMLESFRK